MRGYNLVEFSELQKHLPRYLEMIINLHECRIYCEGEVLAFHRDVIQARSLEIAQTQLENQLRTEFGEHAPDKFGCESSDNGVFVFYFMTQAIYSGRMGQPLLYFIPPPLCMGKLIANLAREDSQVDDKKVLLNWIRELYIDFDTMKGGGFRLLFFVSKRKYIKCVLTYD